MKENRMSMRNNWVTTAKRLMPMLDIERCIDELFDCGLITFGLPDGL
jgi:hypothetical protein